MGSTGGGCEESVTGEGTTPFTIIYRNLLTLSQFNCCGYISNAMFMQDSTCPNVAVAASKQGCAASFCDYANGFLNLIFTASFGFVGKLLCHSLITPYTRLTSAFSLRFDPSPVRGDGSQGSARKGAIPSYRREKWLPGSVNQRLFHSTVDLISRQIASSGVHGGSHSHPREISNVIARTLRCI